MPPPTVQQPRSRQALTRIVPTLRAGASFDVQSILARSVFWTKAKGSGGVLVDGAGTHAIQHGSAAGADSNDPLWLPYQGAQYCYFPGSSANYASSPDSAAVSVTGDLELQVWCALDDWTPGAICHLVSHESGVAGEFSYCLFLNTGGTLSLRWSPDGTSGALITKTSTVVNGIADGAAKWVRATLKVNNGSAQNEVKFYLSDDGVTWTQLGTTVTTAGTTSIFNSPAALGVGAIASGASPCAGKFYRARIYSGFSDAGGTLAFDADFGTARETFATFTESSSNAATVTINRSTSGRKSTVVDRDLYLLGTDDYFEVPDAADLNFALTDSFTLCVVVRKQGVEDGTLIAKLTALDGIAVGWQMDLSGGAGTPRGFLSDGTHNIGPVSGSLTQGVMSQISFVRKVGTDQVQVWTETIAGGNLTDNTTVTLANSEVMRIGRLAGAGTRYLDASFVAAAVFREALSAADLALVKAALLA